MKCADLVPPGYSVHSFPCSPGAASCRGGGIAFIVRDSLKQNVSCSSSIPFYHSCFDVTQLTLTLHNQRYNFFCIYCQLPNKKNAFTDTMFFLYQFPEFFEYCDTLSGKVLIMGDFNIHFETLNDHNSRKMHDISEIFSLSQSVTEPTHKHGHLLDLVFHRHSECLLRSTCLDHGLTSDHTVVLCQLDIPKHAVQPVTTQFRSISKTDKNSFKQDLAQSITPLTPIPDFNRQLCCVLDKHAPLCHCTVC